MERSSQIRCFLSDHAGAAFARFAGKSIGPNVIDKASHVVRATSSGLTRHPCVLMRPSFRPTRYRNPSESILPRSPVKTARLRKIEFVACVLPLPQYRHQLAKPGFGKSLYRTTYSSTCCLTLTSSGFSFVTAHSCRAPIQTVCKIQTGSRTRVPFPRNRIKFS